MVYGPAEEPKMLAGSQLFSCKIICFYAIPESCATCGYGFVNYCKTHRWRYFLTPVVPPYPMGRKELGRVMDGGLLLMDFRNGFLPTGHFGLPKIPRQEFTISAPKQISFAILKNAVRRLLFSSTNNMINFR